MTRPLLPFWAVTGTKTEPPAGKKNAGFKGGKPESGDYFNWFADLVWRWLRGGQGDYATIVVGSSAEVTANDATHTISDFVAALVNGDRVHFLGGQTHTLVRSEDVTESNVVVTADSDAILAFSSFTLTISGAESEVHIKCSGAAAGDVIVTGVGAFFDGLSIDIADISVSAGASAIARSSINESGTKQGIVYGASGSVLLFAVLAKFPFLEGDFTTDFATDDKLDITAHGFPNGMAMQLVTSGTLPAGLSLVTTYFVINQTANDFELSLTVGGGAVDITDDGTGTHTANPYWVVPDGVTRIWADAQGPGASGGRDTTDGGGGGSGGACASGFVDVTPGDAIRVIVGVPGPPKTTDGAGNAGTDTVFSGLTGTGGDPGQGNGNGGNSVAATGGDINIPSGDGQNHELSGASVALGGFGGYSKFGFGGRGTNTAGRVGTGFGGGGAGGKSGDSGAGAPGCVFIWHQ